MPQMDDGEVKFTIFGKVTRGLDIVHAINKREVSRKDNDMQPIPLKQPVSIRSVTIHSTLE
jgi:cyclophilin family peptidyl-prolyl cis-trans isomerase